MASRKEEQDWIEYLRSMYNKYSPTAPGGFLEPGSIASVNLDDPDQPGGIYGGDRMPDPYSSVGDELQKVSDQSNLPGGPLSPALLEKC